MTVQFPMMRLKLPGGGGMSVTPYPTLKFSLLVPQALKLQFLPAIPGSNIHGKVNRSGDTMGGSLVLDHDPVIPLEAATKQYVDFVGAAGVTPGDKGDITVGGGGTWTIDNDAVTYAKMQNISAAGRLLGRGSAGGAGDPEEIILGTNLSMSGTTLNATGGGGGSGDVVGPAPATDNAVVRFDGTTGKLIQNSNVLVADTGATLWTHTGSFRGIDQQQTLPLTGTAPDHDSGYDGHNVFRITQDALTMVGPLGHAKGWTFTHEWGGANATAGSINTGRTAMAVTVYQTGATTKVPGYQSSLSTGAQIAAVTTTNCGGTGFGADASGNIVGANIISSLGAASTFYRGLLGLEIDVGTATGGSADDRNGLFIAGGGQPGNSAFDAAIGIHGAPNPDTPAGLHGWKTAILFYDPLDLDHGSITPTGYVLRAINQDNNTIGNGIDLTGFGTITGNAFASNAFNVTGTGQLTARGLSIATIAGAYTGIFPFGSLASTHYALGADTFGGDPNLYINRPATGVIIFREHGAMTGTGEVRMPSGGGIALAGSASGAVTLATAAAAGTWTLTLPTTAGTSGYFLQTNGSGVTTWAAAGGGGSLSDGDKGDITVSGVGTIWTIDPDVVTYAKMQNVSAVSRLLGRGSAAGAGDPEEIILGTNLSMSGTTLNATGGGGSGDVVGPAAASDNAIARYDNTTGKLIQNSGVQIDDNANVLVPGAVTIIESDTAVSPALNTNGFLELLNSGVAVGRSAQLRFGVEPGDPFAMLSSYAVSGPSPYYGELAFSVRASGTSGPLQNNLFVGNYGARITNGLALVLDGSSSGAVSVKAPAAVTTYSLTLPTTAGTSGWFLQTNGSGVTTWAAAGGSGSPGGSTTQVQFNSSGAFAGDDEFTYDSAGTITLGKATGGSGTIKLKGSTSGTVTIEPAPAAGTWTLRLPDVDGDAGEVLTTDGTGVTSWEAAAAGREVVTAARTYYVNNVTGNDADDGLTAPNAFATIQKAVNVVCDDIYWLNAQATISVAKTGVNYDEQVLLRPWLGNAPNLYDVISITGDLTDPTYATGVLIKPTAAVSARGVITAMGEGARWATAGISVDQSASAAYTETCYAALGGAYYRIGGGDLRSGDLAIAQLYCANGSTMCWDDDGVKPAHIMGVSMTPNFNWGWFVQNDSSLTINTPIEFDNNPAYAVVAWCEQNSFFQYYHQTVFTGVHPTGLRIFLRENSRANSNEDVANIPGDTWTSGYGFAVHPDSIFNHGHFAPLYTYATLPTVVLEGTIVSITDSNTNTPGAAVTSGGGSHRVPLWYTGSGWVVLAPVTGGGGVTDGDKGDVVVSSSGTVWTIDSDAVSYAKMQNVSAASKLLGRGDSGAGDPQEITLGTGLSMSGTTLNSSGGSASLTVGTSPISGGTTKRVLYDLTGVLQEAANFTIESGKPNVVAGQSYLYDGAQLISAQISLENIFIGSPSGNFTMTGTFNTAFGNYALISNTTGIRNLAFGRAALSNSTTGDSNTAIGFHSMLNNISGGGNVAIGGLALAAATAAGSNVAIGNSSMGAATGGTDNLAIGFNTLGINTTGLGNVALGASSMNSNSTGSGNSALGSSSLASNTTGSNNSADGQNALTSNTIGIGNIAYGQNSLRANIDGNNNLALGVTAGFSAQHDSGNIYLGSAAGYGQNGGAANIFLGTQSGTGTSYGSSSGSNNILIGDSQAVADNVTTGSRNISIGDNIKVATNTASNQLNIANFIYGTGLSSTGTTISPGKIGIGKKAPDYEFDIAGALGVRDFIEIPEMTAPAAGAANTARLFVQDNGSGKTQICVRFPTGATQVLATEP